jgi:hypothetical protein
MAATMPSPTPPVSKSFLGLGSGELAPMKTERRFAKDEEALFSLAMEPHRARRAFCSSANLIIVMPSSVKRVHMSEREWIFCSSLVFNTRYNGQPERERESQRERESERERESQRESLSSPLVLPL